MHEKNNVQNYSKNFKNCSEMIRIKTLLKYRKKKYVNGDFLQVSFIDQVDSIERHLLLLFSDFRQSDALTRCDLTVSFRPIPILFPGLTYLFTLFRRYSVDMFIMYARVGSQAIPFFAIRLHKFKKKKLYQKSDKI